MACGFLNQWCVVFVERSQICILWKSTDFQISGSAGVSPDLTLHNVLDPLTWLPTWSGKLLLESLNIV